MIPTNLPWKLIGYLGAMILLIMLVSLTVRSCDKRHARSAQSRVDASQAQAASNSAADAIGTVAKAGEATAASETLTRTNEQQIRAAQGADAKVDPAAHKAGIDALCRRAAYKDDPRCKK